MPRYVKDEINFHIFLKAMRQLHEVTLEQACEGLCSISMMKRIESGERLPEKQMRDRILSRMGVPLEGYEDYLSTEEYEQWALRKKIIGSIEKKNVGEAERYLEAYRVYGEQNAVEVQYCEAMELMILQMKNAPLEKQRVIIERAVKFTMPDIDSGLSEKILLSEQELNLLIEYVCLWKYRGAAEKEFDWRCEQYKEILNYIEHSHLDGFCRAKVYPKAAYYLSEIILHKSKTEENLELGIKICNQAIELLRDSRKLYYFIELADTLEKLVKEIGFYLRRNNKREEAETLRAGLEEKLIWRDVIMELYTEYDVAPYMENFCHVYWETESYCIGDVIRTRRKMFGMTKEQLCEGICSVKTLTRIELKKTKTQMPIVRELFERLGLCAEYIRERVITSDYEVMKLAEECVWYENNYIIDEWEKCLEELESKICMDIPQNKQFMMHSYCLLGLRKKEMNQEQFIEKMIEAIELTISLEYITKAGKKFLSREEYTYIRSIGMRIDADVNNLFMKIIEEICEQDDWNYGLGGGVPTKEFLMTGVISYLGNIGKYKKSDELSTRLTKESLVYRREEVLAECLYNNLWNYKQRLLRKKDMNKEYEKKELQRCFSLSKFGKMTKFIRFFEQKLENCVME